MEGKCQKRALIFEDKGIVAMDAQTNPGYFGSSGISSIQRKQKA